MGEWVNGLTIENCSTCSQQPKTDIGARTLPKRSHRVSVRKSSGRWPLPNRGTHTTCVIVVANERVWPVPVAKSYAANRITGGNAYEIDGRRTVGGVLRCRNPSPTRIPASGSAANSPIARSG